MENKEVLDIVRQLKSDITSFVYVYPDIQLDIAKWIIEDRKVNLKNYKRNSNKNKKK